MVTASNFPNAQFTGLSLHILLNPITAQIHYHMQWWVSRDELAVVRSYNSDNYNFE